MEKYRISLQHKNKHQDPTHFIQAYLEIIKKYLKINQLEEVAYYRYLPFSISQYSSQ